jgi:uncharacterized protein (DUF2147 family)
MVLEQDTHPKQADAFKHHSDHRRPGQGRMRRAMVRLAAFPALFLVFKGVPAQGPLAATAAPPGVWLMDTRVAIQIFDCSGMLCGRVIWLKAPLDPQGLLQRDKLNPDPALRQRQVCGPTIIWNLRPKGNNVWEDGWFYNPEDGKTYRVSMEFIPPDEILARIYQWLPIFGENRTLVRIPMGKSAGWCPAAARS